MLTASAQFADTIDGQEMTVAAALSIDLPTLGDADYTASLKSISFDTQDTSSYPDDLTDKAGYSNTGGSLVLAGPVDPSDETLTWAALMNPDDASSALYRQQVKGSALTFDFGVVPAGQAAELLRRVTGRVQSWTVDVAAGTVSVDFIDLTGDWDELPALPAVVTAEPFNAGLTSEYAIDRIARVASGGTVSSWPAQRANCILAVGLRASLGAEIGVLDTTNAQPSPSFTPGPWGSGLASFDNSATLLDTPAWDLEGAITANVFCQFLVSGIDVGTAKVAVGEFVGSGGGHQTIAGLQVTVSPTGVTVDFFGDGTNSLATVPAAGAHVIAVKAAYSSGTNTWSGTIYLDGLTHAFAGAAAGGVTPATMTLAGVAELSGGAVVAGLMVTTESAPTPDYPFVPQAVLDPSLNPLQAVPAIDAGTKAWDELQAIAEAEGGYITRDNTGRLIFLNRDTIANQTPGREVKVGVSLKAIQTSVGAVDEFDDIAIDYTEWVYGDATSVFSPTAKWKVAAHSTQTWIRTLADGQTAAVTDGPLTVLPDGHNPADGGHWYRASIDKFGNSEHGSTITATVKALTSSQIEITIVNNGGNDAWLVSPANYLDLPAGTVSLWVGGIPVTADDPTTVHASYGDATPTYTVPSNPYRQDRDASIGYATSLLYQLHRAKPTYEGLSIVPDARLVIPDKVTLDIPLAGGAVEAADVLIWGLSFAADFEQHTWDMTLDVRRVAPPGAWLLGTPGASELGDGAGNQGTAYLY